jgi:hypothetical protein
MSALASLLFCMLLVGPLPAVHAKEQYTDDDQPQDSNALLALELARIASRLAAHNGLPGHRRHRRPPPADSPHTEEPAVQNIKKGLVQSVPVAFKGHNLTVVALSHE